MSVAVSGTLAVLLRLAIAPCSPPTIDSIPTAVPAESESEGMANLTTNLTISSSSVTFPALSASDYDAGYVQNSGALTYTMKANSGTVLQRTATLAIRATSANLGGTVAPMNTSLDSLEWKRADQGSWTRITTVYTTVQSCALFRGGNPEQCVNTLNFRLRIGWLDPQQGETWSAPLQFQMTVTLP
jgi:hypothetical protein